LDGLCSQAGQEAGVIGWLCCLGEFLQRECAQRHPRALSQLFQSLGHCVRHVADDQRSHGFLLRASVQPELVL
jgi:hypothetical protein